MDELLLRPAVAADLSTYARLFPELGVDDPVPSPERFVADFVPRMLVAERGGEAVGYAIYRVLERAVHLAHLVTAPEARGGGIARALVAEVVRHARSAGCTEMFLNVKPDNAPAIRLYERLGLVPTHRNHALRVGWATVEGKRAEATLAAHAREVAPSEDAALEAECGLPGGVLAEQRARPGRVIRAITSEPGKNAIAVFDPAFPGAYPFRASDPRHAWSMLLALRPFARPEHDFVGMLLENDATLAAALLAEGATLRLEIVHMRGTLESGS